MKKQGKVLKILDKYTVLVSLGSDDGVTENTVFQIYTTGDEVKDSSGISYGTLDIIKATIIPKYVYPKMTLCTNKESTVKIIKRVNPAYEYSVHSVINRIASPKPTIDEEVEHIAPLNIGEISEDINFKEDSIIQVDDPVKIINGTKSKTIDYVVDEEIE